ncbi:hypothetical protein I3W98_02510 [Streptomyces cavourensis]|nr:hypothetical protein [Streptomyces cavourensis]
MTRVSGFCPGGSAHSTSYATTEPSEWPTTTRVWGVISSAARARTAERSSGSVK